MNETDQDGIGFVPLRTNKMQKFATGHTGHIEFSKRILNQLLN
jgi:hypothetical protein